MVTVKTNYIDDQKHPALVRLFETEGFSHLNEENLDAFLAKEGLKLAIFADNPNDRKTTLDIAVIAPELKKAFEGTLVETAWADFKVARSLAARWGLRSMPSVAIFIDDVFWGAVQGLKTWEEYCRLIPEILLQEKPAPRTIALLNKDASSGCEE